MVPIFFAHKPEKGLAAVLSKLGTAKAVLRKKSFAQNPEKAFAKPLRKLERHEALSESEVKR